MQGYRTQGVSRASDAVDRHCRSSPSKSRHGEASAHGKRIPVATLFFSYSHADEALRDQLENTPFGT